MGGLLFALALGGAFYVARRPGERAAPVLPSSARVDRRTAQSEFPAPLVKKGPATPAPAIVSDWTLIGNTVGPDGTPVPSAEVVLRLQGGEVLSRATSGADGSFAIAGVPPDKKAELDLLAPGGVSRLLWGELPPILQRASASHLMETPTVDLGQIVLGAVVDPAPNGVPGSL